MAFSHVVPARGTHDGIPFGLDFEGGAQGAGRILNVEQVSLERDGMHLPASPIGVVILGWSGERHGC